MEAAGWSGIFPTGEFPYQLFQPLSQSLWVAFWSAQFPKGVWYQDCFTKAWGPDYHRKCGSWLHRLFQQSSLVCVTTKPSCGTEKGQEFWGSPQKISFVKWHSGKRFKKKIPNNNNNNNVMCRKRQKKTKLVSTAFLIKMLSAVVAIAKHNNRAWTHKFRNTQNIVRHDWTN